MAASVIYGIWCNYMPVLGLFILNRTFHFHIPLLNIVFKPWRLYLLSCGLPSLVCAIVLLFMPESPKFTFSKVWACRCEVEFLSVSFSALMHIANMSFQGNEEETLNILRRIYRINNPTRRAEDYNVTRVVEDSEFVDNDSRELCNVSKNPFVMLWKQTCLLFTKKNVKKTVLVCLLQASTWQNHVEWIIDWTFCFLLWFPVWIV